MGSPSRSRWCGQRTWAIAGWRKSTAPKLGRNAPARMNQDGRRRAPEPIFLARKARPVGPGFRIRQRIAASISGHDDDGDDNECRDQRKRAVECFRSGLCDIVERRHGLCWCPQFADEPANISGLHWIRRDRDLFDMIAFRAVERAKFKSCRSRRNARKHHARLAFRTAQSLNCEQWDCGQVIGHAFHL